MLSKVTSVLIVDSDNITRVALTRIFEKSNCNVVAEKSAEGAIDTLLNTHFDIVLSELTLGGSMDGNYLLTVIREKFPSTHVVLMSSEMDSDLKDSLIENGAADCLVRPFDKNACANLLARLKAKSSKRKAA